MKPGKKVNSGKKGTSGSSLQDTTAVQACVYCHVLYGTSNNKKAAEEWLECGKCHVWYHKSCVELCGVLDNFYFTCKDRL